MLPADPSFFAYYFPHGFPEGYLLTTWEKIKFIAGFGFCIGYLCRMAFETIKAKYFSKPKIENIKGDEAARTIKE